MGCAVHRTLGPCGAPRPWPVLPGGPCLRLEVTPTPAVRHAQATAGSTAPHATGCGAMSNIQHKHTCLETTWVSRASGFRLMPAGRGLRSGPQATSVCFGRMAPAHCASPRGSKPPLRARRRSTPRRPEFPSQTSSAPRSTKYPDARLCPPRGQMHGTVTPSKGAALVTLGATSSQSPSLLPNPGWGLLLLRPWGALRSRRPGHGSLRRGTAGTAARARLPGLPSTHARRSVTSKSFFIQLLSSRYTIRSINKCLTLFPIFI